MKDLKNFLLPALALGALLGAGSVAEADTPPLTITFDQAFQDAYAGTSVTFYATIVDVDTTDSQVNLDGDQAYGMSIDDLDFYNNAPYYLTPSDPTSSDFAIFTVDVPADASLGVISGEYEIYGDTGGSQFEVGAATFDVDVVPTPEPASLMLLGTGLVAMAGFARRKFAR